MATNLPYEVKRLIYDYVGVETLKSLRLVSTSWAVVGVESLLLPSFTVRSYSLDIPRLIGIGASPNVSRQAARVIRKIKFYSSVGSFFICALRSLIPYVTSDVYLAMSSL